MTTFLHLIRLMRQSDGSHLSERSTLESSDLFETPHNDDSLEQGQALMTLVHYVSKILVYFF